MRSPSMSPSGMVSIRVRSKPSAPHQAIIRSNSSSLTPLSATMLILTWRPAAFRRRDAGHHLVVLAPAGDRLEARGIQGVERDVDAPHAVLVQLGGEALELAAVGGDGQLVERARAQMAAERSEQAHDVAPDQGLAAGQPDLAHAEVDEGRAQPVQLLEREQVPWAGRSCPRPCSTRSGNRSGR